VQAATTAQLEDDMLTLSLVFEEVVQSCLDQTLSAEILGSMVRDILAAPAADTLDPVSCFLDTVSSLTETESKHATLRQMLVATGIDTSRMRSELENNLLISLDLVRNTFSRVAIRKATHALYRQSNYNLLREEAEGYAKLMTEYFTTVHNEPPSQEVINETLQRMNALIGAFDLDVGRVLDVTLDVFANLLVKHTRFFVKFLRSSPWWPKLSVEDGIEWTEPVVSTLPYWALPESDLWYYTDEEKIEQFHLRDQRDIEFWKSMGKGGAGIKAFFELGARRITSDLPLPQSGDLSDADSAKLSEKEKMNKWSEEYMAKTATLPPLGNPDAAQLLGFKLRFYASDARDAHDILPDNLINLAALLIKIGFISLVDLYPHLYPEYTPEQKQKLKDAVKEKEAKGRGKAMNALTMAAALPDEGQPQSSSVSRLRESESKPSSKPESERTTPSGTEEPKEKLPEPVDQKVALLRSLLAIGAMAEAMFILGRDPWLLEVYPDLRTYLFRLAHHALSKVYEWARPFPQQQAPFVPKQGPFGVSNSQTPRAVDYPPRRTLRWPKLEEKDAGDGIDYRFYWDDWADNVPICQDVDDVFKLSDSLLSFIGLECGADSVLLTKLARIGKKSLAEDSSPSNKRRWIEFCSTFLCPALTFSGQNPGIVNEVWDLLKQFDTGTRYAVYATWFGASKPAIRAQFSDVTVQTKNIMKRISSENTKAMGRAMAKLAYASPGVVFESALKQAQGYGNMIDTLIECSRYLTYLGYDCLTWTLLKSFNSGRNAVQGDGMLTAHWARNTAMFVGKSYKRYSLMDPTPILECVAHELMKGKGNLSTLPMLEQIVTSMAGIGPGGALTESQVLAINAGPRLRAFTLEHYLGDHRHEGKGPQKRLLKVLMESGKSQLAPVILIALALEIQQYIYRPDVENVPMKVLTANLDSLQSHFAQYLDFLRYSLSVKDFDATVPGVVELMADYGIDTPMAFTIARQSISSKVKTARIERKIGATKTAAESQHIEADGDVVMEGSDPTPATNGVTIDSKNDVKMESVVSDDTEMKDVTSPKDIDTRDISTNATVATTQLPGHANPVIEELALGIRNALPDLYGKHPCLTFLITFWELSLIDMFSVISMKEYTNASNFFIEKSKALGYDRRNKDIAEKREALDVQIKSLRAEADEMSANAGHTRTHLREEMQQWFSGIPMVDERSDFLHETLLEECFLPRARLSSEDAQFSSAMLKFMHKAGVPGFRTMKLLDQLFKPKAMGERITLCTPRESQNLGRFLNDVLKELNTWHSSKDKFTSAAQGQQERLPGFGRTFNADRTPSTFVSYDDFRHVLYKWHTQFFKALEECLNSGDYTKIRNAINLLKAVSPIFPKIDTLGKSLYQIIKNMSETESRGDLKLAATSLLGDFKKSEKFWISEQSFHPKPNSSNGAASEKSKPPTAQESAAAKLNATANAFNPRTGSANGVSKLPTKGRNEHEDGEVADSKRSATLSQQDANSTMQLPSRNNDPIIRGSSQDTKPSAGSAMHSSHSAAVSGRPDSRGSTMHPSRVPHALPSKPDTQPLRRPPVDRSIDRPSDRPVERPSERPVERPIDRPVDRPAEYHSRGRDGPPPRGSLGADYGRPDRDPARDGFPDRRGPSPGRRERTRSPDRGPNTLDRRDFRGRDFNDRSMPPPREAPREAPRSGGRGPGWGEHPHDPRDVRDSRDPRDPRDPRDLRDPRDSREHRDPRDARERHDSRGPPLPPSVDNRNRMHPSAPLPADDTSSYRRDFPPKPHQSGDRINSVASRASLDRAPIGPPAAMDRGAAPIDRSMVNPDRAALITHDDRGRNDNFRGDREPRRDRVSSPRRGDERIPSSFNGWADASRDHRDDRTPPQPFPANRDRREEQVGSAPTGPRGARTDVPISASTSASASARISREMFQPSQVSRPAAHQAQDPNYGRLNAPAETIPSGPRSKCSPHFRIAIALLTRHRLDNRSSRSPSSSSCACSSTICSNPRDTSDGRAPKSTYQHRAWSSAYSNRRTYCSKRPAELVANTLGACGFSSISRVPHGSCI
jgi:THO complex subunit 2